MTETTEGFKGKFEFLSNMYECDCPYNGMVFKSSEHLYQWLKVPPEAEWWRTKIFEAPHGKVAKKLAANPKCPKKQTADWDLTRIRYMKIALWSKFTNNPDLKQKLLDTRGATLVEYNHWKDTFWGVCNGEGENRLGKLLMQLREKLQ